MEWTTRTHARTHAVQCRGVLDVFDDRLGIYKAAVGMPPNVERLTRGWNLTIKQGKPATGRITRYDSYPTPPGRTVTRKKLEIERQGTGHRPSACIYACVRWVRVDVDGGPMWLRRVRVE